MWGLLFYRLMRDLPSPPDWFTVDVHDWLGRMVWLLPVKLLVMVLVWGLLLR